MSVEALWTLVSFVLTLLILSYLLGDNPLFRIATYLFVGVTAGYVAVMVIYHTILPRLLLPLLVGEQSDRIFAFVPFLLSVLLLFRLAPGLRGLGNFSLAYLAGAGAAVVVGGAVMGTLVGQMAATIDLFDLNAAAARSEDSLMALLQAVYMSAGVVATLAYFHFSVGRKPSPTSAGRDEPAQRPLLLRLAAGLGQVFIAITLGSLFAGVLTASLTALIERIQFVLTIVTMLTVGA